jgi:alpha-beta hydrolase superfamily lysophospholipase
MLVGQWGIMRPVAVNDCFGWLHTPVDERASDVAVLICPGLLGDELVPYCGLRVLADRLARAGYWTARLEYPGTGDSCDYAVERAGNHWMLGARASSRRSTGSRK